MRSITDSSISRIPTQAASSVKHALDHVPKPDHLPDLPAPDLHHVADQVVDAVEHVGGAAASAAGAAAGVTRSLLERLGIIKVDRRGRYVVIGLVMIGLIAVAAVARRRSSQSNDRPETIAGPQRLAAAG